MSRRIGIRALSVLAAVGCAAGLATACSSNVSGSTANGKIVLKVAYGSQFVFLTPQLAIKWWGTIAREFEKTHPNVTVQYTPIQVATSTSSTR